MLLGALGVKAAPKYVGEINPRVDFTRVLRTAFTRADPKVSKIHLLCQSFLHFWIVCA